MDTQLLLNKIGLTEKEALVYGALLEAGVVPAQEIMKRTGLKRTTVYSVVEDLFEKGLIERDESHAVIRFRARHPYQLKAQLEERVSRIQTAEQILDSVLPELVSQYQTAHNRPGVKFYEGKDGVKKVMNDSLTSKTEILTIADIEAVRKYIYDINEEYIKKRNKKEIPKRLLVQDSAYARERLQNYSDITNAKLFRLDIDPFSTVMQIYDNKIAYLNLTDDFLSGILIEDPFLYSTHKALFNFIWKQI